jgi:hypothetical protein
MKKNKNKLNLTELILIIGVVLASMAIALSATYLLNLIIQ